MDWDRLDAMAGVFGLRQRADIARQQDERDERFLQQQEELIKLLREQKEKERQEKQKQERLEAAERERIKQEKKREAAERKRIKQEKEREAAERAAVERAAVERAAAERRRVEQEKEREKEREAAERRRVNALPKCPDCRNPFEIGSQECSQCGAAVVSWDYHVDGYRWRLVCRRSEVGSFLQDRWNAIVQEANSARNQLLGTIEPINADWRHRAEIAFRGFNQAMSKVRPEQRDRVIDLLWKESKGLPLLDAADQQSLAEMRRRVEDEHSLQRIHSAEQRLDAMKLSRQPGKMEAGSLLTTTMLAAMQAACCSLALLGVGFTSLGALAGLLALLLMVAFAVTTQRDRNARVARDKQEKEIISRLDAQEKAVAAMITARDVALQACDAKADMLQASRRMKLNELGVFDAIKTLTDVMSEPRLVREKAKISEDMLRQRLQFLAATRAFASKLGVSLFSASGVNGGAIEDILSAAMMFPDVSFSWHHNWADGEREIESRCKAVDRLRERLMSLPLAALAVEKLVDD